MSYNHTVIRLSGPVKLLVGTGHSLETHVMDSQSHLWEICHLEIILPYCPGMHGQLFGCAVIPGQLHLPSWQLLNWPVLNSASPPLCPDFTPSSASCLLSTFPTTFAYLDCPAGESIFGRLCNEKVMHFWSLSHEREDDTFAKLALPPTRSRLPSEILC